LSRRQSSNRPILRVRKNFVDRYLSRKRLIPMGFVLVLVLFAFAHVWKQVYVLELSTEVRVLEKENETLNDLVKKRNSEITELTRLAVIEPLAKEKGNLQRTASENLFTLVRDESYRETEGIENLVEALRKVADNMPVITETRAESKDVFEFDEK